MVEVAYTVHENYRKNGLGTMLQERLEAYAKRKGFKGAVGYLFEDNLDAFVNVHDTEILSPPRMKIGTLCQAKGAAVMRSNFL